MRLRLAAGAAALTALAACSSDPAPPSTLPSLSASPSASPSAAPVPSEAAAATPEGAGAFARFWYAQIEEAFATKDPSRLAALSTPSCEVCQRYIASITKLRDNDERVDGYAIEVVAAEAPGGDTGDTTRVTMVYNTTAATRYAADGRVIREEPAFRLLEEELLLRRVDSAWRVEAVSAG